MVFVDFKRSIALDITPDFRGHGRLFNMAYINNKALLKHYRIASGRLSCYTVPDDSRGFKNKYS